MATAATFERGHVQCGVAKSNRLEFAGGQSVELRDHGSKPGQLAPQFAIRLLGPRIVDRTGDFEVMQAAAEQVATMDDANFGRQICILDRTWVDLLAAWLVAKGSRSEFANKAGRDTHRIVQAGSPWRAQPYCFLALRNEEEYQCRQTSISTSS